MVIISANAPCGFIHGNRWVVHKHHACIMFVIIFEFRNAEVRYAELPTDNEIRKQISGVRLNVAFR